MASSLSSQNRHDGGMNFSWVTFLQMTNSYYIYSLRITAVAVGVNVWLVLTETATNFSGTVDLFTEFTELNFFYGVGHQHISVDRF